VTEINLLPQISTEQQRRQEKLKQVNLASSVALVVFTLLVVGTFVYWAFLANETRALSRAFTDNESQLTDKVEVEGLFSGTVYKAGQIKQLKTKLYTPHQLFDDVQSLVQGRIELEDFSIEQDKKIRVVGSTDSESSLNDFIDQIEDLGSLGDLPVGRVSLNSLSKSEDSAYKINFTLELD
jgi:Tfp pilus assembly protein PilN